MSESRTHEKFIETMIAEGKFAPAARTMDLADSVRQYNEANALTPSDPDFMIHPDLYRSTTTGGNGQLIHGFRLRGNRNAFVESGDITQARGVNRISRNLGVMLGL